MKLIWEYIKYRRRTLLAFIICAAVYLLSFILYRAPLRIVLYPALLCLAVLLCMGFADFMSVKKRHDSLAEIKKLSAALIDALPEPQSITDEDYREIIRLLCEEQRSAADRSAAELRDMMDYYTVWAHQIKTPIAAMKLTLQNEDLPQALKLRSELGRIERYVEMVMTYLRLDSDSTDFVLRPYRLDDIIKASLRQFAGDFIGKHIALDYTETNAEVVTDEKWLGFVIGQVLSNALKYTKEGRVTVCMEDKTLCIRDTGIGILPEDLPRIFENGFTGINGRIERSSSGIGLYLCRRICAKLGHEISANSEPDKGTEVNIRFM